MFFMVSLELLFTELVRVVRILVFAQDGALGWNYYYYAETIIMAKLLANLMDSFHLSSDLR